MKKTCNWLSTFSFVCILVLLGCSDTADSVIPAVKSNDEITLRFTESATFAEFKQNFPDEYEHIDFANATKEKINAEVSTVTLPVMNGRRLMGTVVGITRPDGSGFEMIYQNMARFSDTRGGVIELYTAKKDFIADFDAKVEGKQVRYKIDHVGQNKSAMLRSAAATTDDAEWPDPNDPWWTCTTKCYAAAKAACGSDPTCDFLCDLANIPGECTISMAAACAIYCI